MAVFILAFTLSLVIALSLTPLIRRLAFKFGLVDYPDTERKLHAQPTPLLGGLGIFVAFTVTSFVLATATSVLIGKDLSFKALVGLLVGGLLIMVGGYLDDHYHLKPQPQIIWPILAALVVIASGIGVRVISNPLGGLVALDQWKIEVIRLAGIPYYFTVAADLLTFIWLLGMMYTTKLLDGLDGLASGVGAIGSLVIFGLTQFTPFYQPSVGLLGVILAGACLGFLFWNWHPAKVFLGEGGSLYIGFVLGVLAIISGAKIATTLLVMGIPILDVAWVIVRRLWWDKKSLASSDRRHLHYRLLDIGLTHRQAVVVLYALTASFGLTSLFLRTEGKLWALVCLMIVMVVLGWVVVRRHQLTQQKNKGTVI
ncbi:MAG: undecaprenyl/decaprenyl-phosphate alpha-N-acetylglucosaminyl 1-phosphate transferase [Candidatus Kerfeldbacteria bacterium]|nr:undecaprenyl/decaprenyl-phosphate alpha-N-acetylglucosaminyl 1-phosphate transferase [Candidatus Kerfeldbacteria bacterium]